MPHVAMTHAIRRIIDFCFTRYRSLLFSNFLRCFQDRFARKYIVCRPAPLPTDDSLEIAKPETSKLFVRLDIRQFPS
jgi:hypothetical protein